MRYPLLALLALGLFTSGCETAEPSASAQRDTASEAETRALARQGNLESRGVVAVLGWIRREPGSVEQLTAVANDGSVLAAKTLASAYQSGIVAEKDFAQAARWLQVAADLGDADAARELAVYNASV